MKPKKPADREQFILDHLHGDSHRMADVLDAEFVNAYIEATGAPFTAQNFGASKCSMLGRDLSSLYRKGLVRRERCGVGGESGFPKWVYVYQSI